MRRLLLIAIVLAACKEEKPAEPPPPPDKTALPAKPAEAAKAPAGETGGEFPPPAAKGGDCDAVADRMVLVMKAYPDDDAEKMMKPAEREQMLAMMRSETFTLCQRSWSQPLRDCMLTATSGDELDACGRGLPK